MKIKKITKLNNQYLACDISTKNENFFIKCGDKYILIHNSPAIVCGINPENGKFFISSKSAFNKNPKVAYSATEVGEIFQGGVVDKLKYCFEYLPKLGISDIIQGDLLFTDSKSYQDIDGIENIIFRPNTITYAVKKDSDVGKEIDIAKLGIVFHTKYEGSLLSSLSSSPIKELHLKKIPGVWWTTANIENVSKTGSLSVMELQNINEKLSSIGKLFHKLNKEFYNEIIMLKLPDIVEHAINSYIRTNKFPEYEDIVGRVPESAAKLYSNKRSLATKQFLEKYSEQFKALMQIYKMLFDLKIIFVNKFNKIDSKIQSFIQTDAGFEVTAPEGYCFVKDGSIMKLVDRLNFSKNNFNIVKNWGEQ